MPILMLTPTDSKNFINLIFIIPYNNLVFVERHFWFIDAFPNSALHGSLEIYLKL